MNNALIDCPISHHTKDIPGDSTFDTSDIPLEILMEVTKTASKFNATTNNEYEGDIHELIEMGDLLKQLYKPETAFLIVKLEDLPHWADSKFSGQEANLNPA